MCVYATLVPSDLYRRRQTHIVWLTVIDCQMPLEGKILIVCIHHVGHQHYSTPMWWRALPWYVFSSLMKNGLWFGMLFSLVSTQVLLFNTGASPHSNVSICFFFALHCIATLQPAYHRPGPPIYQMRRDESDWTEQDDHPRDTTISRLTSHRTAAQLGPAVT